VKYVAGRLGSGLPAHVDEGDLVSYGLLGLIGAIERYDPARDVKFESYAMARIKGQFIDGEIARSSIAALDELWTVSGSGGGSDQVALIDTIEDESAPDPQGTLSVTEQKEALADAIARLPEREKLVVTLYYYEELTLREIGEVLGVTESRVSQLHTKAILRLKAHIASAGAAAAM
jgi:RNA polymerase sigma factor for flagellar operon FliA